MLPPLVWLFNFAALTPLLFWYCGFCNSSGLGHTLNCCSCQNFSIQWWKDEREMLLPMTHSVYYWPWQNGHECRTSQGVWVDFGGAPRQCVTSGDIWQYIWMAGRRSTRAVVGRWLSLCTTLLEGVRSASVLPNAWAFLKGEYSVQHAVQLLLNRMIDYSPTRSFPLSQSGARWKVKFTFCRLVESVHSQVWP